jgi:Hsp70 protein
VVVHRDSESISSLFIVCSQPISSSHLSPSYFQVSDLVKADEKTRIRITSIVKSLVPVSTVAKPPALLSIDTDVFDVLAAMDNTRLPGGDDFDNRVIDHLIKLYKKKTGTDVTSNQRALGKLTLSGSLNLRSRRPSAHSPASGPLVSGSNLSRTAMTSLRRSSGPTARRHKVARKPWEQVQEVLVCTISLVLSLS